MKEKIAVKILGISIFLTAFMIIALNPYAAGEQRFQYDARGRRDPLVPLIGKDKPSILKLENVTSVEDARLEGIADGAMGKIAILNGELVKENDKFGEVVIKKIANRSVTITIEGKLYTIALPEEGGRK